MGQFTGIIFDMDGVLLHSSPIHAEAFRTVLADLPIAGFDYAAIAGMRTDEALRKVLAANGITLTEEELRAKGVEKSHLARIRIREQNPVDPDCGRLLASLAVQYHLALASSASQETINVFLGRNGLRDHFSCVLHGDDVKRAKPDPEIYELACQRLGMAAKQCLVIEDAASGVQAGKAAGATVWAVPTTEQPAVLQQAGADRILSGLSELFCLVGADG